MKSTEFITEHSNWAVDIRYSDKLMSELMLTCNAAANFFKKHGYDVRFSIHFFDQMKLKRGKVGPYSVEDLTRALVEILRRGMQFFKGKVPGTNFVFHDQKTNIFIAIVRDDVDHYTATTTVRDYKWLGDGQVIKL
jgi:hypothetical protein